MKNLINNVVTSLEEHLATQSGSYKHEFMQLYDVSHERHTLFKHMVTSTKESVILKVKDLIDCFTQ